MNRKLVAIGGGSWQNEETLKIDQKAIALCGKTQPLVLFVPAASRDDQGYAKRFKAYYRSLGCQCDAIRLFHTKKGAEELAALFLSYDMIYLGGGDTSLLVEILKEKHLDEVLIKAYERGIVITGYSAGANVLFTYGYSETKDGLAFVKGLGIHTGVFTPHAQKRPEYRKEAEKLDLPIYQCKDQEAWVMEESGYYLS